MRVRFLTLRFDTTAGGGAHQSLDLKLRAMRERGHEADLTCVLPGAPRPPTDAPYRTRHAPVDPASQLRLARGVEALLRGMEEEADVFHLDGAPLLWGAARYRRAGGRRPVLCWVNSYLLFCTDQSRMDGICHQTCNFLTRALHSPSPAWKKPFHLLHERRLSTQPAEPDVLVFPSPYALEAHRRLGIVNTRMEALPEFVDTAALAAAAPGTPPPGFGGGSVDILYAGRLVREKGVDLLLDAFGRLPPSAKARLHIVGDGPLRADLERRAGALRGRVVFHGWLPREGALALVRHSSFFVHPSYWPEPLGIVMLEAMAVGLPVVCPRESGAAWMVDAGGLPFRNGDVEELSRRLAELAQDGSLRDRLARAARKRAAGFDYRGGAARLEQLYASIMDRAPEPAAA